MSAVVPLPQIPPRAMSDTTPRRLARAGAPTSPADQSRSDTHSAPVGGGTKPETGATPFATPRADPRPSLFDPTLYVLAQFLDDIEGLRKAQGNRKRILTATDPDEDGRVRGFGLDATHPVVAIIEGLSGQLDAIEHQAILALNRAMRKHPLVFWQRSAKGVGEKQLARLLAATGDPYINATTGQPRTVNQLWAYCGLHTLPAADHEVHDTQASVVGGGGTLPAGAKANPTPTATSPLPGTAVAARRRKGERANWSTTAKTRAYLIAEKCVQAGVRDGEGVTEYGRLYKERRAHTAITHATDPDWTPGHSHNDGLRIVAKEVLKDLWRAGRDYHEGQVTP